MLLKFREFAMVTALSLELCCGTGSFTKVMQSMYPTHEHYTVDIDPSCHATYTGDILAWDYERLLPPSKYRVTHIWASPPCTQYSNMRTTGPPRDIQGANRIVARVLEIIRYYRSKHPLLWYIENPASSLLKRQPFMQGLPYFDVNYCAYEPSWGQRKGTRVWTNRTGFVPRRCAGPRRCEAMSLDTTTGRWRHNQTVKGRFWKTGVWKSKRQKQMWMGRVPPALIMDLVISMMHPPHPNALPLSTRHT